MEWIFKYFTELSLSELYMVMQARIAVFIVEQNCPFQDADDADQASWHLMGWMNERLLAYSRIVPPGIKFSEPSIGRVITTAAGRGCGYGKILMVESIRRCEMLFPGQSISIGAQFYLKRFYESFGFRQCSEIYDEDGIPHINMILRR